MESAQPLLHFGVASLVDAVLELSEQRAMAAGFLWSDEAVVTPSSRLSATRERSRAYAGEWSTSMVRSSSLANGPLMYLSGCRVNARTALKASVSRHVGCWGR